MDIVPHTAYSIQSGAGVILRTVTSLHPEHVGFSPGGGQGCSGGHCRAHRNAAIFFPLGRRYAVLSLSNNMVTALWNVGRPNTAHLASDDPETSRMRMLRP